MTAPTSLRATTFAVSNGFGFKPTMFKKNNGNLALERVAVFRSGTFRDSMGIQNTWEKIHIDQMLSNYKHLRDNNIFADVPVRDGHPGWLIHGLQGNGKVVGWHTNVYTEELASPHDGEKYHYILGDFEITDPEGQQQIENGTWRNRSAEIGNYTTNSEAEFWPVYLGVAYVDIPAVEGLRFSSPNGNVKFYLMMDKENGVGDTTSTTAAPGQPTGQPVPALPFGSRDAAPQVYAVNGVQVSDPVAVQGHINTLEQFRKDTTEQNRKDFVTGLAHSKKIGANQIDALSAFALNLTPAQYADWVKTYGDAPVSSVLGNHGDGVTNANNAAQSDTKADQHLIWSETVKAHMMAGMSVEAVKNTASYKHLVAAGQTPQL